MSVISAFPSFDFTPLSFINNGSLTSAATRLIAGPISARALIKLQILTLGKLLQQRQLTEPETHGLGWGASPSDARRDVAPHIAARRNLRASTDPDVAHDADLAPERYEIAELRAS